jgi:hypothetical protein
MTHTRVLPRLRFGLTGPAAPVASNPIREGGSVSTRLMASRDAHSSASSFTLRVNWACGPVASLVTRTVREAASVHGLWLRMTITQALPRLHFGLLGLRPRGFASDPNREGGSVSTRLMASRDAHSSASSFTLRVNWACGPVASNPIRVLGLVLSKLELADIPKPPIRLQHDQ